MTDFAREKYERLMARVAELEERIEDLQNQLAGDEGAADPPAAAVIRQELRDRAEQLAQARSELSRISDGCGKPHSF
ncbi:MAG: ABC transporter C-terminal domain-containing protein [Opitutaceae bacterium]|nr:ABC transporter C-terminal domain-containing protein [Opitutaceae bacterium]